ncbi:MAG: hypothetical protein QOE68_3104 [Thermoanaerobaculia bacterium]|jgi:hypothetical protein|nr:hypothetical protein [Thermoanaerobaculia bacterium]
MTEESFGIQGFTADDKRVVAGSRFSVVRDAVFANPYQKVWGTKGNGLFERFPVTFAPLIKGLLPGGGSWEFLAAAKRILASDSDLRWGADGKGFRRLLHANGICMTGMWEVTEETPYSGYFKKGSRGLIIARYSTCCTETRRGNMRSLSMIGRIYPTTDPSHPEPLPTASFITQEDIGGENTPYINDAKLRNAPNTTVTRRGSGMPILLLTGMVLNIAEKKPTIRQVYQIAELGKPPSEPTRSPEFMQLTVAPGQPAIPGNDLDFRDEIMAHIYDPGDSVPKRKLVFNIETSDTGTTHGLPIKERRDITNWKKIGTMTFDAAVVSFNADHVFHVNHPAWREDRNDPRTVVPSKV